MKFIYIPKPDRRRKTFKFNFKHIAVSPGHTIQKMITSLNDGIHIIEGKNIIPCIYKVQNKITNLYFMNEYTEDTYTHPNDLLSEPFDEISIVIPSENRMSAFNNNLSMEIRKKLLDEIYRKMNEEPHSMENSRIKVLHEIIRIFHIIKGKIENMQEVTHEYNDIFQLKGDNLPSIKDHYHRIDLDTQEPIVSKLYNHPLHSRDVIDRPIEEFWRQAIVEPSSLPYLSPVWCVPKRIDASNEKNSESWLI